MTRNKKLGIVITSVLAAAAFFCGIMFARQYRDAKNSESSFDELAGLIVENEPHEEQVTDAVEFEQEITEEELASIEAAAALERYGTLFDQNNDFMGWISIEDTNINYPVMQTPNNPDYYLNHSFEKDYSDYGVPYIEESCAVGLSNNIVVYGHHMKNGSMFAHLCNYADKSFYEKNKTIRFDTLSNLGEYEVVAVFKFNTNQEDFRYNEYCTMDESTFNDFMNQVHDRELYDTGIDAEYGDQLLTLSTCEYTYTNGRLVVIAKKVT